MRAGVAAPLLAVRTASAAQSGTMSFRCRNDLANLGDNKGAVSAKCGEPIARDSFCRAPTPAAGEKPPTVVPCETVETWTYNPGDGQRMTTLRFESGTLKAIEYGDRAR